MLETTRGRPQNESLSAKQHGTTYVLSCRKSMLLKARHNQLDYLQGLQLYPLANSGGSLNGNETWISVVNESEVKTICHKHQK